MTSQVAARATIVLKSIDPVLVLAITSSRWPHESVENVPIICDVRQNGANDPDQS